MRKSKTRRIRRKRKTKINQIKPIKNQNHPKIKIKTPRSRPTKKNPIKEKTSKKKRSKLVNQFQEKSKLRRRRMQSKRFHLKMVTSSKSLKM